MAAKTKDVTEPALVAQETEKASAETHAEKPLTEKQMAKQEKDLGNLQDRIVIQSSYNDGTPQQTRYSGEYRYDRES
jgi:hypothetical protein